MKPDGIAEKDEGYPRTLAGLWKVRIYRASDPATASGLTPYEGTAELPICVEKLGLRLDVKARNGAPSPVLVDDEVVLSTVRIGDNRYYATYNSKKNHYTVTINFDENVTFNRLTRHNDPHSIDLID